jgi:hypothetical protein
MRNPFKLWWRRIRGPRRGYRVPASPFQIYFVGRPRLFFLKSRHRLRTQLEALPSLATKFSMTVERQTTRVFSTLGARGKWALERARTHLARVDRWLIRLRYEMQSRTAKHSRAILGTLMVVAPAVSLSLDAARCRGSLF